MEKRAEHEWLVIWSSPQQTAQVAIRDLLEQLVGLRHKIASTSFPRVKKRLAPIDSDLQAVLQEIVDNPQAVCDRGVLSERMNQVECKFDRLARMHLCGYQRKDDRLLHLVAGSDRLLAGTTLTMIANPNGSAMRPLAIGGLRAQSKSGDLPGSIGMITRLHRGRVESELHELFKFVSRDSIDSLDRVDREDDPSAFPRERRMESFLGVEDDDVPIEVSVGAGDHPAVYVPSVLPERVLDPESATLEVTELDDHVRGGVIARITMGFRLLIIENGERREHGLWHLLLDVLGDRLDRPRPRTARGSQTSDASVPIGTSEESAASLASCFMMPLIRQVESELHDLFA